MREFEYAAPASLPEAINLLSRANGEGRSLAGGTDLIAQMKENRRSPALVVDVKRIPELNILSFDEKQGLRVGAAVSCTRIASFPPARERYPALAEACGLIGSVQIQNRAAVGGNFCNATPSADTVPPILSYGGKVIMAGPNGRRELPAESFFIGPGTDCARQGRNPGRDHYSNAARFIPGPHTSVSFRAKKWTSLWPAWDPSCSSVPMAGVVNRRVLRWQR